MALLNKNDCRDWFVMIFAANLAVAATVYLFKFHSDVTFVTWGTILTTIGGIFHWLTVKDAKVPDACPGNS